MNLASLGDIYDSTIIRSTCHYNDDIYHIELSNIADCSVTRHRYKQYAPIESIVDSEHHMHISFDCVACMEFAMNDYLIEWLLQERWKKDD